MASAAPVHRAQQHRTARRGIEAISVTSARSFPRHAHDELGLGLIGFGAHRTWSPQGEVEAEAGDVITVNPGEIHDGAPLGHAPRAWWMLYFDPAVVAVELEAQGPIEIARPALRDPALRRRLQRLFAALTAPSADPLAVDEALVQALTLVVRRHGAQVAAPLGASPSVAHARRRIDDAPDAKVGLAELADLAGVSRFQLLRGFMRELGTTPHAYLLQQRVRLARRLLGEGRAPAQAAAEAGFADQSHLTRAFVRQLGITPARYRSAVA